MDTKTINNNINTDKTLDGFIANIRNCLNLYIKNLKTNAIYSLILLSRDNISEIDSTYTLMISARILNKYNDTTTTRNLLEFLKDNMSNKFFSKISKIYVFKTEDNIVKSLNSALNITNAKTFLKNASVNGTFFEDAIVLESKKPV